eukprot:TRINITY_DN12108_c0_g1_i1.p1 TRINITY_DN12108_c0_g1~~TRINITY_DN12108_c0_g1_i1.p1  ORF type:complete len:522 (+),score=116.16 TRINITY_DN12108_c0_g1_i1:38-1603(+)
MESPWKDDMAKRRTAYKKKFDGSSLRNRQDESIQIRKKKREETMFKRRRAEVDSDDEDYEVTPFNSNAQKVELEELRKMIYSQDDHVLLNAVTSYRKQLSHREHPPIKEVIEQGVIPRLVEILGRNDNSHLQFEAAWALTNVASGTSEHVKTLIHAGAVPVFRDLLTSPDQDVREQGVWALGNIAGDSPQCRDFVLDHNIMESIMQNLLETNRPEMFRNAAWTISNLCRGKPQPNWNLVSKSIPALCRLIYFEDTRTLIDTCWAFSHLSNGSNDQIQVIVECGICRRLVQLLAHPLFAIQTPTLRTIGNIVTGDDVQTQVLLNVKLLPQLRNLLHSPKRGIRKESCWTISNITAGNRIQIQAVLDAEIIPELIQLMDTEQFDIKKEASWAISNITSGGTPGQIKYLVSKNVIPVLCNTLTCPDARVVSIAMEALENILKVGITLDTGTGNPFVKEVESYKGNEKLEVLAMHQNQEISKNACTILDNYFSLNDLDIEPSVNDSGNFNFQGGINPNQNFNFSG